ncbi:hypothetical protein ATEIFO6365_0016014700 [Aspergillus terreus]|uniref:Uncharacterized protein n=1 Tax=Aspergillus terreus TaxID=33178 RepID=A0A5M3ZE00_ASPTE|nr:hypothetical protein ATETN484_0017015200 [Aspergillus terreus]GFF21823.1 hypothetical protein ATEIFO6365_0016014700 [Aspergillus terreus]
MDSFAWSSLPLSPAKQLSATLPLTRGSPAAGNQTPAPSNPENPEQLSRHDRHDRDGLASTAPPQEKPDKQEKQHRHLIFDTAALDAARLRPRHKHKHSKSRDGRFPRLMNPIASSAGGSAKALFPTWSGGREKDNDADNGLLRPVTRETTRSRWGSESTVGFGTGSRKGSLFEDMDAGTKLGLIRPQEIRSVEDLEQVRERRKQGEEFLRSALSFIGTLATDITRRLDYTYYNLLEKIAALNTTVSSFQELSDSTTTLLADFERETRSLEQDVRKQIGELREFQPQIQRIENLEQRMRAGRTRASALSDRLEAMRAEIDRWEKREVEFQTRVNRRLRIFWAAVAAAILTAVIALVIQNWTTVSGSEGFAQAGELANRTTLWRDSHQTEGSLHRSNKPESTTRPSEPSPDPLRMLDEL